MSSYGARPGQDGTLGHCAEPGNTGHQRRIHATCGSVNPLRSRGRPLTNGKLSPPRRIRSPHPPHSQRQKRLPPALDGQDRPDPGAADQLGGAVIRGTVAINRSRPPQREGVAHQRGPCPVARCWFRGVARLGALPGPRWPPRDRARGVGAGAAPARRSGRARRPTDAVRTPRSWPPEVPPGSGP